MSVIPRFQTGNPIANANANANGAVTLSRHLHTLLLNLQVRAFFKNGRSRLEVTPEKDKSRTTRRAQADEILKENIVRFQITMANDACTSEHILALLASSEHLAVLIRVADHPRCPEPVLRRLASHPHVEVRCALAQNPSLSPDIAMILAMDTPASVRYTLAESYTVHCSLFTVHCEILSMLMKDESPYVACSAAQTLNRRD